MLRKVYNKLYIQYLLKRSAKGAYMDKLTRYEGRGLAAEEASTFVLPPPEEIKLMLMDLMQLAEADLAVMTIIKNDKQVTVSQVGLDLYGGLLEDYVQGIDLKFGLCPFVVGENRPLAVEDTTTEPLFEGCIAPRYCKAYAGAPFHFRGFPIGAIALGAQHQRSWSSRVQDMLEVAAKETTESVAKLSS